LAPNENCDQREAVARRRIETSPRSAQARPFASPAELAIWPQHGSQRSYVPRLTNQ
jgi:hypothetical protein